MISRTALRVAACAGLAAILNWPGLPTALAADAAESLAASVDRPPATAPSPRPGKRGATGRVTEAPATSVEPSAAEEQTDSDRPRLRGLGKQRYPREEPDVGFGGPSRTRNAGGEAAR